MATPRNQQEPRSPRADAERTDAPRETEPDTGARERSASRDVRDDEHDGGFGDGPL